VCVCVWGGGLTTFGLPRQYVIYYIQKARRGGAPTHEKVRRRPGSTGTGHCCLGVSSSSYADFESRSETGFSCLHDFSQYLLQNVALYLKRTNFNIPSSLLLRTMSYYIK
jgi:hypothetical protein